MYYVDLHFRHTLLKLYAFPLFIIVFFRICCNDACKQSMTWDEWYLQLDNNMAAFVYSKRTPLATNISQASFCYHGNLPLESTWLLQF